MMAMIGCLFFPSCQENESMDVEMDQNIPEGYVAVSFKASIPDMNQVQVRAVDPDGINVHNNMILFCFNEYGLFITTVQAEFPSNYTEGMEGTFSAVIPKETHIIHFVANQNPDLFDNDSFKNQTEDEVQSHMYGATGMMIYWARFESDGNPNTPIDTELKAKNTADESTYEGIKLMRNQAMVSIAAWETNYLHVTGFVTTNIHAYGTTAPYHPTLGFPTCNADGFGTNTYWWNTTDFVTLPTDRVMMSDITDVNTASADYIFEHENTLENPVSVIIRGHLPNQTEQYDKYYRIMLIGSDGEQLMIRRNHHYKINIAGALTYGQDTFEDALTAPATNNVWIAVDDWVDEVTDGTYTLSVSQTSAVYEELDTDDDRNRFFTYKISKESGLLTAEDIASVTWLDGNNVADYAIGNSFNSDTGVGTITITLVRNMGTNHQLSGILLVKKGNLQRKIAVTMIKTQKFTPAWVSAQVYGEQVGAPVTLKFTIPETCPSDLFPFTALISTNSLDIRPASGNPLPVLRKGEEGYFGGDYGWDYKYEYVVKGPGVHRIYFTNVQTHPDGDHQKLYVEAPFFETLEKVVTYVAHQYAITLKGTETYIPEGFENSDDKEFVHYLMVPQKKNAFVQLEMVLNDGNGPVNAGSNDEFFIYSKSLDYYTGTSANINGDDIIFDCEFVDNVNETWNEGTNGRMAVFRPVSGYIPNSNGTYRLYMKTNTAVSDDVIRIASNDHGGAAYWDANMGTDGKYIGKEYRSTIFELRNYHPFHFNASVYGVNTDNEPHTSDKEEVVTNVAWDYAAPGKEIVIKFDLAGFEQDSKTIDPLGTEFRVFIDAPMLEAVPNQTNVETLSDGRIVYTVPANATLGTTVEVKCKTKKITSAGEIKISSDKDVVVYYDKTFKVTNNKIQGTLKYNDGTTERSVPKDAFVSFALKKNGTRIGSITMTEDGKYSLNLRSEYEFGWNSDPYHTPNDNRIELNYKTSDGKVYDMVVHDLAKLKEMAENNEPIVLSESDDTNIHSSN